jgi:branched-chain amino acid transport system substrate-binding protein
MNAWYLSRIKTLSSNAGLFSFVLSLGFSGIAQTQPITRVIKIGLVGNFSAVTQIDLNPFEHDFTLGAELAVENSKKFLESKNLDIKFVKFDYGSDLSKVREVANRANQEDIIVLIGYPSSNQALLAAPLHQQAGLPVISLTATANRLFELGRYIHMFTFSNQYTGSLMADIAIRKLAKGRAVVISMANNAYCEDLATSFTSYYESLGGLVVRHIHLLSETSDYSKSLSQLKDLKFSLMVLPNPEFESARIMLETMKLGMNPKFLGADGWTSIGRRMFPMLNQYSWEGFAVDFWHKDLNIQISRQFYMQFRKKTDQRPTAPIVAAYDAMMVMIHILGDLKSYSRSDVETGLKNMTTYRGASGEYIFKNGSTYRKTAVLIRNKGSRFVLSDVIHPKVEDR